MQHLIVTLIFAACLYLVIRRIVRYITQARKGNAKCYTCTETSCPLHEAYKKNNRNCKRRSTKKNMFFSKNCKKSHA